MSRRASFLPPVPGFAFRASLVPQFGHHDPDRFVLAFSRAPPRTLRHRGVLDRSAPCPRGPRRERRERGPGRVGPRSRGELRDALSPREPGLRRRVRRELHELDAPASLHGGGALGRDEGIAPFLAPDPHVLHGGGRAPEPRAQPGAHALRDGDAPRHRRLLSRHGLFHRPPLRTSRLHAGGRPGSEPSPPELLDDDPSALALPGLRGELRPLRLRHRQR
ncbi:MAG: hypothetical protein KatS3mg076_2158 [Candidatus Binatia bacterium]|nr:MAG: hypothetical protein KatS3mg076_2158 [Candidatus Binatia bacterium]